jgi:hypothetical protein
MPRNLNEFYLMGAGGGEDAGVVLLCMCGSEATLCKQQPKNGYTEVIGIEEKVVFEFSFKTCLVHEDLLSTVEYCKL